MDPTDEHEVAEHLEQLVSDTTREAFVSATVSAAESDTPGFIIEYPDGQRFRILVIQA